nr:folate family ECF transporter S component [uncultured Sellimonas sp.]
MRKMKHLKTMFRESLEELKDSRTLVVVAMLLASAVVLMIFGTVQLTEFLKVGFSFLPNELAAMLFGPAVGGIVAGTADILKYLAKPVGAFFPGFTISAILGGMIYGIILYKKPLSVKRIIAAKVIVALFINSFLNTAWLMLMYGNSFFAMLPVRILKQILMVPLETILFYLVVKTLSKAHVFAMIKSKRQK